MATYKYFSVRGQNTLCYISVKEVKIRYIWVKETKIYCVTAESKKPKYTAFHLSQRNQNTLCYIRAKEAKIHCITPESKQPVTYPGGVLHRRHASAVKLDNGLVFAHVVSSVGCQGILQDVCRGQSTIETAIRIAPTTGLLVADCLTICVDEAYATLGFLVVVLFLYFVLQVVFLWIKL